MESKVESRHGLSHVAMPRQASGSATVSVFLRFFTSTRASSPSSLNDLDINTGSRANKKLVWHSKSYFSSSEKPKNRRHPHHFLYQSVDFLVLLIFLIS